MPIRHPVTTRTERASGHPADRLGADTRPAHEYRATQRAFAPRAVADDARADDLRRALSRTGEGRGRPEGAWEMRTAAVDYESTGATMGRGPVFDRRAALRLAGGATVGALALVAVTACSDEPIYLPDPLAAQEVLARADAAAASAAIALAPERQAALNAVAAQRTEHAEALRAEINRVIGVYGDGTTPVHRTAEPYPASTGPGPSPAAPGTAAPPIAPPTVAQLRDQLTRSRQSSAELARTQSGYRAGLLASISAACAAQTGVLLA
ncbi:hypothetical protein [Nocardia sp. NPDC005366]|uniref:hypothetical protein n=1 Tax=Nocardia sp. NPDC005366 TaxID=3156878 RepID=UPI0033B6A9D6